MNGQERKNIQPGIEVDIVLKQDQRTGKNDAWNCKRHIDQVSPTPTRN